jgi:hypothetical protein
LLASQLKVYVDDGCISKFALPRVTELVGNKKLGTASAGKKRVGLVSSGVAPAGGVGTAGSGKN